MGFKPFMFHIFNNISFYSTAEFSGGGAVFNVSTPHFSNCLLLKNNNWI